MKKVLSIVLATTMALSLAACGSTSKPATSSTPSGSGTSSSSESKSFKVGIMTATLSQSEEEYRAAENIVAKYGEDKAVHLTFPDNATKEQEATISLAMSLASDPDITAIIFDTAMEGTAAAMNKVRESRPEILLLAGVPSESPDTITAAADMVIHPDVAGMGTQVAEAAAACGAKTLIHYSFPRHMAQPLNIARHDNMKAKCEELGIAFVDVTTPDPMSDAGVSATQQFILEDVPRQVETYGENTAFFGTNAGQQEPMCKAAYQTHAIYPLPDNPSVFYAFPGALGIEIPEESRGNVEYMQAAISEKLATNSMTGRMGCWSVPEQTMFINCLYQYAVQYSEGKIADKCDLFALTNIMTEYAGGNVSIRQYTDPSNNVTYDNFLVILGNYVTL